MTTVNKQISLGTDDCEEVNDATINLTGVTTVVGYISGVYDVGLRWQSINIVKETTLTSAKLSLRQQFSFGTLSANIRGIDEDNTATWSSGSRPSQRTKTSATITANQANWTNWGDGNWIDIDITSVIQEIINRAGWSANNALAVVVEDTAGSGSSYLQAAAYEWTGNIRGAKLDIVYTPAVGGARPPRVFTGPFHGPFGGPIQ